MSERRDWLALSSASGLGPAGFWSLMKRFGSPVAALDASGSELKQVPGLNGGVCEAIQQADELRGAAEAELNRLGRRNCRLLCSVDPEYPELLRNTVHPPPVLYVRGRTELLSRPAVALVGSRAATSYGRRVSFSLARGLAQKGITVVSGLAMGIDAEAHCGSLEGKGGTIGVLGCGLDVIYPRCNKALYSRIEANGLLVSEYPLGTRPDGFRFPARNRIIAGMVLGVIVVEAARKSGSLITVQYALDEGREVFAVPGQIDSVKSGGTHWLLQQGASLVVSAEDVCRFLRLDMDDGSSHSCENDAEPVDLRLDDETSALLSHIEHYPKRRDELIRQADLPPAKVSELLLLLELEGLIELLPGDEVRKTGESCR